MKGTTKIAVVIALVIVVLGGSLVAKEINDNRSDNDAYNMYYYYLDGMGEINGWYQIKDTSAVSGLNNILTYKGISHNISGGWVKEIDGNVGNSSESTGFGIFEYTSTSVASPWEGNFFAGPTLDKVTSNIVYISFGTYTYDASGVTYAVSPTTTTDTNLMKTGPFAADVDYKPLPSVNGTYYVYLDGMGDINGWYSAEADNPLDGFKNALNAANISYTVTDSGWIKEIDGNIGNSSEKTGLGVFGYASSSVASPGAGYFFSGPTVDKITSNIVYISFGTYTMDASFNATYAVNPETTTDSNFLLDGPFKAGDVPAKKDVYYVYLDGMDDINGWYAAYGDDIVDATKRALSNYGISATIENGWVKEIDGNVGNSLESTGFGIFEYTSTSVASPWEGNFFAGPTLDKVTSNIVYISFGTYTYDASGVTYAVSPTTTTDTNLMKTGPFAADVDYKPLPSVNGTYYVYLDGMGDINGWYSAEADNPLDGFKNALNAANISYTVTDSGWIKEIDGNIGNSSEKIGLGVFGYASSSVDDPWAGYFFAGPTVDKITSNIIYISFGTYTYDASYNVTYAVNPQTTTDVNLMKTGPFAA